MRLSQLELRAGDWGKAIAYADDGIEAALQTGQRPLQADLLCTCALVLAHLGRVEEAGAGQPRAAARAELWRGDRSGHRAVGARLPRPLPRRRRCRPSGSRRSARRAGARASSTRRDRYLGDLGEALVAMGRVDEAEDPAPELHELGRSLRGHRRWPSRRECGGSPRPRPGTSRAPSLISSARSSTTRPSIPFEEARILLSLGSAQRARGGARTSARRSPLPLGASRASGGRSGRTNARRARPDRRPHAVGEWPHPDRVAGRAARRRGHEQQEAAATLVLSVDTVEAALTSIYRKLDLLSAPSWHASSRCGGGQTLGISRSRPGARCLGPLDGAPQRPRRSTQRGACRPADDRCPRRSRRIVLAVVSRLAGTMRSSSTVWHAHAALATSACRCSAPARGAPRASALAEPSSRRSRCACRTAVIGAAGGCSTCPARFTAALPSPWRGAGRWRVTALRSAAFRTGELDDRRPEPRPRRAGRLRRCRRIPHAGRERRRVGRRCPSRGACARRRRVRRRRSHRRRRVRPSLRCCARTGASWSTSNDSRPRWGRPVSRSTRTVPASSRARRRPGSSHRQRPAPASRGTTSQQPSFPSCSSSRARTACRPRAPPGCSSLARGARRTADGRVRERRHAHVVGAEALVRPPTRPRRRGRRDRTLVRGARDACGSADRTGRRRRQPGRRGPRRDSRAGRRSGPRRRGGPRAGRRYGRPGGRAARARRLDRLVRVAARAGDAAPLLESGMRLLPLAARRRARPGGEARRGRPAPGRHLLGGREETRAEGFTSTVVLDPDHTAGAAFGAGGTPMAVLVDAEWRIASPLVAGGEAVLDLARRGGPVLVAR